jgi:PPM family protein phosphatase
VTVVVVDVVDDNGRAVAASASLGEDAPTTRSIPGRVRYADDDLDEADAGRRGRRGRRAELATAEGPRHRAPRGRRVTWRVVLFVALLLALAGGVVATIQWYGQSAYFVGFEGDRVAIFRGRPGGVLWIEPELVETFPLERSRVPADTIDRLEAGQEHTSRADAEAYVERVTERADELNPPASTTTTTRPGATTTTAPGAQPGTTAAPPASPGTTAAR